MLKIILIIVAAIIINAILNVLIGPLYDFFDIENPIVDRDFNYYRALLDLFYDDDEVETIAIIFAPIAIFFPLYVIVVLAKFSFTNISEKIKNSLENKADELDRKRGR